MRTGAAVLVIGVAATLGTSIGAIVLPDRDTSVSPSDRPSSVSSSTPTRTGSAAPSDTTRATPSPSVQPSRSPSQGSVGGANLLSTADLHDAGLTLTPLSADARLELVSCTEHETLDAVAASGPPVQRRWEGGSVLVDEQAVTARDPDEAAEIVARVLAKLEACQRADPGHWVYGPTHTQRLGSSTTASWLGEVAGELNTNGRAPKGEPISGGTAVLRSGIHLAVLHVAWCSSAGDEAACVKAPSGSNQQLAALTRTAALRLG